MSRAQLLAAGISRSAIHRALRAGRLHRLYPGVYSLAATELLAENAQLVAALLAAGDGAMLALGTAAWRWELIPARPVRIELAVPHRRAIAGVVLFELARPRPSDVTWNGRFRSTSVARTLIDLAIRDDTCALLRAMAEPEFHHDLRPADILGTLRRGHPGSANLRAALDAHVPGRGTARSDLERAFRRLLIKHGVELPLRNEPVGRWEVDCLWPADGLVVELDGGHHDRPTRRLRTASATCGCAWCAATATSSSRRNRGPSSPTCSMPSLGRPSRRRASRRGPRGAWAAPPRSARARRR